MTDYKRIIFLDVDGTKYGVSNDDSIPYYRKHYHEGDIDYEYVIFDDDTDFLLG